MYYYRLKRVAVELNVGMSTLADYLSSKGYSVELNSNTKIDEEQYELLVAAFNNEEKREELEQDTLPPADSPFNVFGKTDLSEIHQELRPDFKKKIETNGTHEAHTPDFIETKYTKLEGPRLINKVDLSQFDSSNYNTRSGIFSEGDIVAVKVTGIQSYGAFVQVKNGPSGLIHNSEISWSCVQNAANFVSVGDEFLAKIIKITDDGKLALSRKELLLDNLLTVKVGDVLEGIIVDKKEFGFLVKVGDFTALLPNKEVHLSYYEVGDFVRCEVIQNIYEEEKHRHRIILSERKRHEDFSTKHEIGEHIICNVVSVKGENERKYIMVSHEKTIFKILPEQLIEPYKTKLQTDGIAKGQELECVYTEFHPQKRTITLDMRPIARERNEAKIKEYSSILEEGKPLEAVVTDVKSWEARVKLTGIVGDEIEGVVAKENANWNRIEPLSDLLYIGETINVVYIGLENGQIQFGIKTLLEKPYDEFLYDLNIDELLQNIGHSTNLFIGQAVQEGDWFFVDNLYSCGRNINGEMVEEGKLLVDTKYGYRLKALLHGKDFEVGHFYKVKLILKPKATRLERNQLYQFIAHIIEEVDDPYKEDVDVAFRLNSSPSANMALASTINSIGRDRYSTKERMFYELIQNADDASPLSGVSVAIKTVGDYIVFQHDGYSFNKDDFYAIISSANGTKKANIDKTGYKGIGFKSVFTDSEQVYIVSGGYRFVFDKTFPIFQDYEAFYRKVNPYYSEDAFRQFMSDHLYAKQHFQKSESIPWQLEPIWVEKNQIPVPFSNENVTILLKIGEYKIEDESGYKNAANLMMNEPKFMLFLRNTKRIDFNDIVLSRETDGSTLTIKNSFKDLRVEKYEKKDFIVDVNDESFSKENIGLRIKIKEQDTVSGEVKNAVFVDSRGQEVSDIPQKMAIARQTTISFAVPISTQDNSVDPYRKYPLVSLFAFLPTTVHEFRFPFYINANFVLDPPREKVLGYNPWNHYLMRKIAYNIVTWCAELCERKQRNALRVLLPNYFDNQSTEIKLLADSFNESYKKAIETIPFILDNNNGLATQQEIVVDKTGLSTIIGDACFLKMVDTTRRLPSSMIDTDILDNHLFEEIERIGIKKVVEKIENGTIVDVWYRKANVDSQKLFHKWLWENRDECKNVITKFPLLQFGNSLLSYDEICDNDNFVISSPDISSLKNILNKCGIQISKESDDGFYNDIIKLLPKKKEDVLFAHICDVIASHNIVLSPDEKVKLITTNFDGVGDKTIASVKLFSNTNGVPTPLCEMVSYKEDEDSLLKPYMICKEESRDEIKKFLVAEDNVFSEIIWEHIDAIGIPIDELYKRYTWSDSRYTKELIKKYKETDNYRCLLNIVELSGTDVIIEYLNNIVSLYLQTGRTYDKQSYEHRVISLANNVRRPEILAPKIFFDGRCITDFALTDIVMVNTDSTKTIPMPLSKLLPSYANISEPINQIKALFEDRHVMDNVFIAKNKPKEEVYAELNKLLGIVHPTYRAWSSGQGNAYQYLFSVSRRRQAWSVVKGLTIDLSQESDVFIFEMMDYLYDKGVNILSSYLTCKIVHYFNGCYLDNPYILETERILPAIERWANDEKKINYLLSNGVRGKEDAVVKLRKDFLDNVETTIPKDDRNAAIALLDYLTSNKAAQLPFSGENQLCLLRQINGIKPSVVSSFFDMDEIMADASEWGTGEYQAWKEKRYIVISLFPTAFPQNIKYKDKIVAKIDYEDPYYYDKEHKRLYVNSTKGVKDVLFVVAREGRTELTMDDYYDLCLKGTVSVSIDVLVENEKAIENKDKKIREQSIQIEQYESQINDLKKKIKELESVQVDVSETSISTPSVSIRGTNPPLSKPPMLEAQLEAQKRLKQEKPNWKFPELLGQCKDTGEPYHYSTFEIVDENGDVIPIVLKSYKQQTEPFKVNPEEWDYVTKEDALLLIYTGKDIVKITKEDLVRNQSSVSISFSTANLDISDRIDAFAESLHYFKELHFDFDSFNVPKDAVSIRNLFKTNEGYQNDNTENDI